MYGRGAVVLHVGEFPGRNALTSRQCRGSIPTCRPGDCSCCVPYSSESVGTTCAPRRPPRRRRRRKPRKRPESLRPPPSPPAPIASGALSVRRVSYLIAASPGRPTADKTQSQRDSAAASVTRAASVCDGLLACRMPCTHNNNHPASRNAQMFKLLEVTQCCLE